MPEVRGTADVDGGAYLLFLPLPRTPSRLSSLRSSDGRTGTDRTCVSNADADCAPFYVPFVAMGVVYVAGPVRPPHSTPNGNYHRLGW